MNLFVTKDKLKKLVRKEIQALTEGEEDSVTMESLLRPTPVSGSGVSNEYKTYDEQVTATYKKYNGKDDLGTWLVRTIVDTRTAFISGEGLSVATEDENLAEFYDKVLQQNRLKGSRFHNMVKASEMEGKQLLTATYIPEKNGKEPRVKIVTQNSKFAGGKDYQVYLEDSNDVTDIKKVTERLEDGTEVELKGDFIFVRIGGDSSKVNETPTRCGLILQQIDNFSRSLNVMRRNNHLFARVTPFFKTDTMRDANTLMEQIKKLGWQLGSSFAGPADLDLKVPDVGAMQNVQAELLSLTKAISSVSGIPIHWFGYVDAMSNRSVAENLFEAINNATIQERSIWQESIYDVLLKAQEIAIDNGLLSGSVNRNFEVNIPLISFARSVELVKNLSLAYHDKVISRADYQNALPGIDPYQTNKMIKEDKLNNARPDDVDQNNDPSQLSKGKPDYIGPNNGANNNIKRGDRNGQ